MEMLAVEDADNAYLPCVRHASDVMQVVYRTGALTNQAQGCGDGILNIGRGGLDSTES